MDRPHYNDPQGRMNMMVRWRALALASLAYVGAFSAAADPIQIVGEPQDVTLEEGQTLTLSVDVIGTAPSFQWYRGTTRLTTNTTRELVWRNIRTNDAGSFYVVVSNSVSVVTSRPAAVTVLRDTTPPALLSAEQYINSVGTLSTNRILLTFNEPLIRVVFPQSSSSATNVRNYTIREFDTTNVVGISNALPGGGVPQVLLTVGPLNPASMYLVTVSNLIDVRSNVMTRPGFAFIGFYTSNALVAFDSIWAWDESGNDLGTAWRQRDYDDRFWPRGRGVFAYEFDNIDLCGASKNTALSLGPMTYYFRFPFVVPRTSGKAIFSFVTETIDDGAVIYLNGQELRRVNMPAGPVSAATPASVARDGTCFRPGVPGAVAVTNLVEGTNVLAVEVHQAAADFDVVFGMQLNAFVQLSYPVQVPLNIARAPSGDVVLSWTGRDGVLKVSTDLRGPWAVVATNSPAKFSPEASALFFRLDPLSR